MDRINPHYSPREHQLGVGAVIGSWIACAAVLALLVVCGGIV